MCEFWKNKEGSHPKLNTLIYVKDIVNKIWIPEDNISDIIINFLEYQENLPKGKSQFWFPPFKIQIPLDPYDLDIELKKKKNKINLI